MKEALNKSIDDIDNQILEIMHRDARISMTELGKRVHLTSQAVKNRLERLSDLGVIQRYTVNVNCPVYGYKIHAIIRLKADMQQQEKLIAFLRKSNYHILHFYHTTGMQAYNIDSYFLDDAEMQNFLDCIQQYGTYEINLVLKDISLDESAND